MNKEPENIKTFSSNTQLQVPCAIKPNTTCNQPYCKMVYHQFQAHIAQNQWIQAVIKENIEKLGTKKI